LLAYCIYRTKIHGIKQKNIFYISLFGCLLKPLTTELNTSTQRCLTRFLVGILLLEPWILLIYAWKPANATIIHSVYKSCIISPTCFCITLPSSGSVPSAFWEMLKWGEFDRILWMGVFVGFSRIFLLGILIFKRLTARHFISLSTLKG
jgi:hypothetical protein